MMPVSAPKLFGVQNLLSQAQSDTLIFRDLKWIDRSPTMVVEPLIDGTPSGELERISITPNAFIGVDFSSAALASRGISDQRFCAGYAKAREEHAGFYTVACPHSATIAQGKQCPQCLALDEFSAMHGIHRGARLTSAAEDYAELEHWLYIATFPDGTSKVGTASAHSKPRRLDEQAVACATYVAHANDGRQVRIWEDLVTREAGLVQAKQARAKYKAWTSPLPASEIKEAHEKAVALATWSLQEAALFEDYIEEDQIIAEKWQPSPAMKSAYSSIAEGNDGSLHTFEPLLNSPRGFYINGATGKFLVAHFGNSEAVFLVNLAEVANRAFIVTDTVTEEPTTQGSLF